MSRVIRLAFLAPEIVEQVVNGCQPPVLTAESLLKDRTELPLAWEAQHRVLGFPFPTDPSDSSTLGAQNSTQECEALYQLDGFGGRPHRGRKARTSPSQPRAQSHLRGQDTRK